MTRKKFALRKTNSSKNFLYFIATRVAQCHRSNAIAISAAFPQ